jgi:hypothetical protein
MCQKPTSLCALDFGAALRLQCRTATLRRASQVRLGSPHPHAALAGTVPACGEAHEYMATPAKRGYVFEKPEMTRCIKLIESSARSSGLLSHAALPEAPSISLLGASRQGTIDVDWRPVRVSGQADDEGE